MGEDKKANPGSPAYYAQLDYQNWTRFQKTIRFLLRIIWRLVARVQIDGTPHVPLSDGLVLAVNHVYILDTPLYLAFYPRRMVIMVLDRWRKWPVIGWFVNAIGNAIYVSREGVNKEALACALRALKAGGCVGITPEGTVSKSRTLMKGNSGVAFLANRTNVPVLPSVSWGQEKAFQHWIRFRRVPVTIRFGEVIHLPPGKADSVQLEAYTAQIMNSLNALLPVNYQSRNT
ncbi:MAG: lysophospholipid acyltransferase family protein [bacterium]|nr:lysophospholipid acyltransferase family protein [bacterium]